jgi:hypothetical protein
MDHAIHVECVKANLFTHANAPIWRRTFVVTQYPFAKLLFAAG